MGPGCGGMWGEVEGHRSRRAAAKTQLTYLAHVCSIFQALSLLAGRSSPGSGSSLGKWEAWPSNLQRKEPCPPQPPLSVSAESSAPCFRKPRLTWPDLQLTVLGHKGGTVLSRKPTGGAAPRAVWGAGARGSAALRARTPGWHHWLARVARHQLSCQPRGEAGLPAASVLGPPRPQVTAAAWTHPSVFPAWMMLAEEQRA